MRPGKTEHPRASIFKSALGRVLISFTTPSAINKLSAFNIGSFRSPLTTFPMFSINNVPIVSSIYARFGIHFRHHNSGLMRYMQIYRALSRNVVHWIELGTQGFSAHAHQALHAIPHKRDDFDHRLQFVLSIKALSPHRNILGSDRQQHVFSRVGFHRMTTQGSDRGLDPSRLPVRPRLLHATLHSSAELLPHNTASPSRCAPASIVSNSAAGPIHQSGTALAAAPRPTDARSKTVSAVVRAESGFIFAYGRVSIFP